MSHSPNASNCQHALLARSPVGHVSVCPDCGIVHLAMDCVSVRLDLSAFLALAEMVSQAQKHLHSHSAPIDNAHCSELSPVVH